MRNEIEICRYWLLVATEPSVFLAPMNDEFAPVGGGNRLTASFWIIIILLWVRTEINNGEKDWFIQWYQWHINLFRDILCLEFTILLCHEFLYRSIWSMDGTLTGTTTLGQSWLGSNDNEGVVQMTQKVKDWSLTIRCCLVSCLEHYFVVREGPSPHVGYSQRILRPVDMEDCTEKGSRVRS